jgi:hypothetical protein
MQFATTSNRGNREFAWRQPDQDASATLPGHANTLLECAERGRSNQNAVSSAAGPYRLNALIGHGSFLF